MTARQGQLIGGGLLAVLLAWFLVWFFSNYERAYQEVRSEVSAEARRNPLLAAERFLQRIGVAARSVHGRQTLLEPPAEPGLLLALRLGPDLDEAQADRLEAWIAAGGHLVVTPPAFWDEEAQSGGNRLLDRYGVQLHRAVFKEEGDPGPAAEAKSLLHDPIKAALEAGRRKLELKFPEDDTPVHLAFSGWRVLRDDEEAPADWRAGAVEGGHHLLQYRIGDGLLTVLSDLDLLTNQQIGEQDHAYLLARPAEDAPRAWLLFRSDVPPLPILLWQRYPELVAAVLGWLPLWLWWLTRRSGPLLAAGERPRRNLLEHLEAAGRFAWRCERGRSLFRASQAAVEHAWRRRHPALERLAPPARAAWIAERIGLAPRAVEAALYREAPEEGDFVRASAALQRLAAELEK